MHRTTAHRRTRPNIGSLFPSVGQVWATIDWPARGHRAASECFFTTSLARDPGADIRARLRAGRAISADGGDVPGLQFLRVCRDFSAGGPSPAQVVVHCPLRDSVPPNARAPERSTDLPIDGPPRALGDGEDCAERWFAGFDFPSALAAISATKQAPEQSEHEDAPCRTRLAPFAD